MLLEMHEQIMQASNNKLMHMLVRMHQPLRAQLLINDYGIKEKMIKLKCKDTGSWQKQSRRTRNSTAATGTTANSK